MQPGRVNQGLLDHVWNGMARFSVWEKNIYRSCFQPQVFQIHTDTRVHVHTYLPQTLWQENKPWSRRSSESCLTAPALSIRPGQLFSRPPGTKPVGRRIARLEMDTKRSAGF